MRRRSTNANPESLLGKKRPTVDHPFATVGKRSLRRATAIPVPTICMMMNIGAENGSIPAKVSERDRATVTAGLAKLVDEVK